MSGFWDNINFEQKMFSDRRRLVGKEASVLNFRNILAVMHPDRETRRKYLKQVWLGTQLAALSDRIHGQRVQFPEVTAEEAIVPGLEVGSGRRTPIPLENWTKPSFIVAGAGSGKSSLAHMLARCIVDEKHKEFYFVDHGNEANRLPNIFGERVIVLRPDQLTVNIFAPPTDEQAVPFYASMLANVASSFSLPPSNYLYAPEIPQRMLRSRRPGDPFPSLWDIEQGFQKAAAHGRSKFGTTAYALAALRIALGPASLIREGVRPSQPVHAFKLGGLPTRVAQFLNAQLLLRELMTSFATGFASGLKRVLYIDEGLFGFSRQTQTSTPTSHASVADLYATQPRKHGLAVLIGFQSFADVHPAFLGNCGTAFVGRLPQLDVATDAAEFLQLPPDLIPTIQTLPPGRFWMRSIGYSGPVLVQVPLVDAGRYLSDSVIDRMMAPKLASLEQHITRAPAPRDDAPPIHYMNDDVGSRTGDCVSDESTGPASSGIAPKVEIPLRAEHILFMRDIVEHGDSMTADRYSRLGLSAGKGNRIKEDLDTLGLIGSHRRRSGHGRPPEVMRLTEAGLQAIKEAKA